MATDPQRLRTESDLFDALEPVAAALPEGRYAVTDPAARVAVSHHHLAEALRCPARLALAGPSTFTPSVAIATRALALAVLDQIVHGEPAPDPVTAYRTAYAEGERDQFPWEWLTGRDQRHPATDADRAAGAMRAVELATAVTRVVPDLRTRVTRVGERCRWDHPQRPVRLQGRVDLVLGPLRPEGTAELLVVFPGSWSPLIRPRLAYEALLLTLHRQRPATVTAVCLAEGRTYSHPVTPDLLGEGIAATATAVDAVAGGLRKDPRGLTRRPGPHCERCPSAASCGPGTAWLDGPGRRRAGFLVGPHDRAVDEEV